MMLVAEYVKVFSRTGTQPFLFTCHAGDRHRVTISKVCEQFAARWRRGDIRALYLTDANILSCLGRWHPLLASVPGIWQSSSTLRTILGKQFPHCRRAKKQSKSIRAGNEDSSTGTNLGM